MAMVKSIYIINLHASKTATERRNQCGGADFDRDLRRTMQERQADVPHVSGAACSICRTLMAIQCQASGPACRHIRREGSCQGKTKKLDLDAGRGAK